MHTSTSHVVSHTRKNSLLAILLQQFPRPEATEAGLDPRCRGLNGLLSLSHQETANARLDLRRRFLLERLLSTLSLQQMLLRLHMFLLLLLLLVPLLVLLILLLLTTALRGFLQLLAHAVSTEIGLDLRRRGVSLHRVGVLLRSLRHERSSKPVMRSSVSRSLKSVRKISSSPRCFTKADSAKISAFSRIAYKNRFRRDSCTFTAYL